MKFLTLQLSLLSIVLALAVAGFGHWLNLSIWLAVSAVLIMALNTWLAILPLSFSKTKDHLNRYLIGMIVRLFLLGIAFAWILSSYCPTLKHQLVFLGSAMLSFVIFLALEIRYFIGLQKKDTKPLAVMG